MKKITIVTGHYGTGKTNYSVNLALEAARTGEPVTIVDLDIVNPYFRTADFGSLFAEHGVTMITPDYANSNVDIPVLNFDLERIASDPGYLIVDVGGDDAGATALGRYAEAFAQYGEQLDMLYVINCYRYLTSTPQEALEMLYEIEQASHMKHTGIVNNSNLGSETTAAHIESSLPFARELARQAGLPLLYTTYDDRLSPSGVGLHPVHVHVRPIWD
ncbi:cobalamin biosynthesis protein CobQ [Ruminococcus sp.]|uniref:cobalamin biosynthesis protein CobQ n=1 Tax=Ruminococcus sp. TaxID=41978 RepID=UPI0025E00A87|nr:cobalamin biosynthesis protein CobQ [Ruminococcus sp.]MCI5815643.1 cobalamin biosynthesis protein CobQ [Ruminococcus sp.]MDD7556480.1 cobalamin biosynthesis protein CobQ [Ruminococcus sp.]MDY4963118.1 cobalamin biosynthesis protein CobQ [Ruminococcus callidus]